MNNGELNRLLKSAAEPGRPAEYWETFPDKVVSSLAGPPRSHRAVPVSAPPRAAVGWFALGARMAAACLLLAFVLRWAGDRNSADFSASDLAVMRKYLQEMEALFPSQVQAVVFEENGPQIVLADRASVPANLPVYVRVCGTEGCRSFLTFSGQQIRLNGETVDVLVDAHGNVLLVGSKFSWSSGGSSSRVGSLKIVARSLESVS